MLEGNKGTMPHLVFITTGIINLITVSFWNICRMIMTSGTPATATWSVSYRAVKSPRRPTVVYGGNWGFLFTEFYRREKGSGLLYFINNEDFKRKSEGQYLNANFLFCQVRMISKNISSLCLYLTKERNLNNKILSREYFQTNKILMKFPHTIFIFCFFIIDHRTNA